MSSAAKPDGSAEPWAGHQVAFSFGASAGIQLINVATGVLLARTLGPHGRGELAAVILWPTMLSVLGSLAVMQSLTHHAARGAAPAKTLAGTGVALALAQSVVLIGVGLLLLPVVLGQYGSETVDTAYINLAFVPLSLVTLTLMGVLNGIRRYGRFHAVRVAVIIVPALILGGLAVVGELRPRTAVYAYLVGNLLAGLLAAAALRGSEGPARPDRELAAGIVRFGLRSQTSAAGATLNSRLDQLVVSVVLSPALLGIYVVATTLGSVTALVGVSMAFVALPAVSRLRPGEDRPEIVRLLVSSTFAASALASMIVIALADPIVHTFFGSEFARAAGVGRILLVGMIAYSTNRTLEAVLQGLGRPLEAGAGEGVALAAAALSMAALLPLLGLSGAALATAIAYILSMAFMLVRVRRATGLSVAEQLVPPRGFIKPGALVRRLRDPRGR